MPDSGKERSSLSEAFLAIWRRRDFVLATMAVFIVLAVVYLQIVPRKYAVFLQVAPVQMDTGAGRGGASALQSLTGMDLSDLLGGSGTTFKLYTDSLNSWTAAAELSRNQVLLQRLFPEEWSDEGKSWHPPFSLVTPVLRVAAGLFGIPMRPWQPPNAERMYRYLQDNVEVINGGKSPVVTVLINMKNPQLASDFLLVLNKTVDNILRERARSRAEKYIAFLRNELNEVTVTDYRSAIIAVLAHQEQTRMMASANVSYSGEIFAGPTTPTKPTSPDAIVILISAVVIGMFAGFGVALAAERNGWSLRRMLRTSFGNFLLPDAGKDEIR